MHKAMETGSIISAVKDGSNKAFSILREQFRPLISATKANYSKSGLESDDIEQYAMIALYHAACMYDPKRGNFPSFAKLCIERAICDELRKLNPQSKSIDEIVGEGDNEGTFDKYDDSLRVEHVENDVLSAIAYDEQVKLVKQTLSEKEYTIFFLFLEGLSYKEINEKTGISKGNIAAILTRARKKLRGIFSKEKDESKDPKSAKPKKSKKPE